MPRVISLQKNPLPQLLPQFKTEFPGVPIIQKCLESVPAGGSAKQDEYFLAGSQIAESARIFSESQA
jgi:hypothetical protein